MGVSCSKNVRHLVPCEQNPRFQENRHRRAHVRPRQWPNVRFFSPKQALSLMSAVHLPFADERYDDRQPCMATQVEFGCR